MNPNQPSNPPDISNQRDRSIVTIEFPFRLQSSLTEIAIADDMLVRQMDDKTKARLLHIENVQYNENGKLSQFTSLPGCIFSISASIDIDEEFCSSNYVLVAPSSERAREFNFALKLAGNSCSSLYIGYDPNGITHFLHPPCYFGQSALIVTQDEAPCLAKLVEQIAQARGDKRLKMMQDIYMHALTLGPRNESRFLEIAIILEMLLLPSSSQELSYRFGLRLAKVMDKLFSSSLTVVFERGRSIYGTRSRLVHSGNDNRLDAIAPIAYDYARTLLAAYLDDSTLFDDANLDALCLG